MYTRVIGASAALKQFRESFAQRRTAHAYLVLGEPGAGKGTLALFMSCMLNCTGGAPCLECNDCKKTLSMNHPDVHTYSTDKKAIPVDHMREFVSEAYIKAFEGKYKIFVIDKADKMTDAAQNCLLKILEEPPGDTVFILLCDAIDPILPTVRSRCRPIRLEGADDALIERELAAKYPNRDISKIRDAVRASDGLVGRADALINDIGYWTLRDAANGLTDIIMDKRDIPRAFTVIAEYKDSAADILLILEEMFSERLRSAVDQHDRAGEQKYLNIVRHIIDARLALRSYANFNATIDTMLIKIKSAIEIERNI